MQCLTQIIDRSMNEKLLLMSSQRNFSINNKWCEKSKKENKENEERMKEK